MSEPVLCYVSGSEAFFTTQPLDKQRGDDWNDAPYEHNAGKPYGYRDTKWDVATREWVPNDAPAYEIIEVFFISSLVPPCDDVGTGPNSRFSVEQINAKQVPWLSYGGWLGVPKVSIWAGTTLSEFKRLIREAGGRVFVEELP